MTPAGPPKVLSARDALDHLLIGAPTLESGIRWLEGRTGVRATVGGSHPGLGTWNALASLGPMQYIEIIAPDPAQPGVETFYVPDLRGFAEPRIATWAARVMGLGTRLATALPPDFSCEPARAGARVRPDGTRLAWTLAFPRHREEGNFGGALPFFIEWESLDHHPGRSTPAGMTLRSLSIQHPKAESLSRALAVLGIGGVVEPAPVVSLQAELDTPRGIVVIR